MRMRLLVAALTLAGTFAVAQEDMKRFELSPGYAFASTDQVGARSNTSGWDGSLTYNLSHWLGAEADVSGNYYSTSASGAFGGVPVGVSASSSNHAFLFGPRVAARGGKMVPFAHGLLGMNRQSVSVSSNFLTPVNLSAADSAFATALGGGLNYHISPRVGLRTQLDYLLTNHGASAGVPRQNNIRGIGGLVFTFGNSSSLSAKNAQSRPSGGQH